MKSLINSAMIPGDGLYNYKTINRGQFMVKLQGWHNSESGFTSYIGYPDTAAYVEKITGGVPVMVNRSKFTMSPGDVALVVKLNYRVPAPGDKGKFVPGDNDWEYGILRRVE